MFLCLLLYILFSSLYKYCYVDLYHLYISVSYTFLKSPYFNGFSSLITERDLKLKPNEKFLLDLFRNYFKKFGQIWNFRAV